MPTLFNNCARTPDNTLWKRVDVDESLMYGSMGGFMGLEELDADYDLTKDEEGVMQVRVKRGKHGMWPIPSVL